MPRNTWSKEEIDFIKENGKYMTIKQIANHLGRTTKAVNSKVHHEGLVVLREHDSGEKNRKLTKYQIKFIKENIETMCLGDIARKLHTSAFNIEDTMKEHGIVKATIKEEYIDGKMQDYIELMKRVEQVKRKLTRDGKFGKYKLDKLYKDKAVLFDARGHRVCLTFMELVIKVAGVQKEECA